jgi:hypothetical protein
MATFYRRGKTFTVAYRLKGGPRQYVYGINTLSLARQVKAKKDTEEQLSRAGLLHVDPVAQKLSAAATKLPLEHVRDFEQDIRARDQRSAVCATAGRARPPADRNDPAAIDRGHSSGAIPGGDP